MRSTLNGPQILAFLPAVTLASFWIGGESGLLVCALGLPAAFALAGSFEFSDDEATFGYRSDGEDTFVHAVDIALAAAENSLRKPACYLLQLDEYNTLSERYGPDTTRTVEQRVAERLARSLRRGDRLFPLGNGRFGLITAAEERLSLEAAIQIGTRLQSAIAEPFSLDGLSLYASCSVGFCLCGNAPRPGGGETLRAAQAALDLAHQHGPGAIRAYSPDLALRAEEDEPLADRMAEAIEEGQIIAHFQPQISASTGEITGFEALARWQHPDRGLLPPGAFLPAVAAAGLSERLCHRMLQEALSALVHWREAGLSVPGVGINLSTEELRNPQIADHIRWELDRHGVPAAQLTLEVLETVAVGHGDEMIARNLAALAAMGCQIDLDDFGTGFAAIANIRRFSIQRVKIDRCFITHVDTDADQQTTVAAILAFAERLGMETLAEGVETLAEQATLARMGCGHVQGYGIARPMPLAETDTWIARHSARLAHLAGGLGAASGKAPPPPASRHG
ncbi:GGDEF domain-containing phosphodiesterase [Pseudoruegeria sp. SHC-113]|nr:GGDEF domain-containing phosphodiesterase [Pseudoruegeria sp. SHC-113]